MAIETTITTIAIEMKEEAIKEENVIPAASVTFSVVVVTNITIEPHISEARFCYLVYKILIKLVFYLKM